MWCKPNPTLPMLVCKSPGWSANLRRSLDPPPGVLPPSRRRSRATPPANQWQTTPSSWWTVSPRPFSLNLHLRRKCLSEQTILDSWILRLLLSVCSSRNRLRVEKGISKVCCRLFPWQSLHEPLLPRRFSSNKTGEFWLSQIITYNYWLRLALQDLDDCKVLWQFLGSVKFTLDSIFRALERVFSSLITFPSKICRSWWTKQALVIRNGRKSRGLLTVF